MIYQTDVAADAVFKVDRRKNRMPTAAFHPVTGMRRLAIDIWDTHRFLLAQEPVFATVLAELRRGQKESHWMWFIFPQLRDLGRSETARHFGLAGVDEASMYLAHPILGPRLVQVTEAVLAIQDRSLYEIFGSPDDLKFRSCMTLFSLVVEDQRAYPFSQALARFCEGEPDRLTLALVSA
ncbi:DUF1810 domain-containing protein [Rhizobium wuzhouense]